MAMKKIPLAEATREQLQHHAEAVAGINLGPNRDNVKRETLISKIQQVGHEEVMVAEPDASADAVAEDMAQADQAAMKRTQGRRAIGGASSRSDPVIQILIPEEDKRGGDRPVPVNVNGTTILLPRAQPIDIAYRYYEALENARQTLYDQNPETGEISSKQVYATQFQVLRWPDKADLDRYKATQAEEARKAEEETIKQRERREARMLA